MIKTSTQYVESKRKKVIKTPISKLRYKYVDHQKEEHKRWLLEEQKKMQEDSDYEPDRNGIDDKTDYSNLIINKMQEAFIDVEPTNGVTLYNFNNKNSKSKGKKAKRGPPFKHNSKKYVNIINC
jgi:hypothetical protein